MNAHNLAKLKVSVAFINFTHSNGTSPLLLSPCVANCYVDECVFAFILD